MRRAGGRKGMRGINAIHWTTIMALLEASANGTPAYCFLSRIDASRASKTVVGTAEAADGLRKRGHHLVEFLSGRLATKLYFDAERYVGGSPPTEEQLAGFLAEVTARLDPMMDILRLAVPDVSYVIAQRHGFDPKRGEFKMSFRPFVQGFGLPYSDIPRFLSNTRGLEEWNTPPLWDTSVYKASEQLLCAIGGTKSPDDKRVLLPIDEAHMADERILMYVAQHLPPGWQVADTSYLDEACEAPASDPSPLEAHEAEEAYELVRRCLGDVVAHGSRDRWRNIGIVLKTWAADDDTTEARHMALWLDLSRKGGALFPGDRKAIFQWRTFPSRAGTVRGVGLGTLVMYAKEATPDAYREWKAWRRDRRTAASAASEASAGPLTVAVPRVAEMPDADAARLRVALALPAAVKRWKFEAADGGSVKLTPCNCRTCLRSPAHEHMATAQSCLFLTATTATLSCPEHGNKTLRGDSHALVIEALRVVLGDMLPTRDARAKKAERQTNDQIARRLMEMCTGLNERYRHVPELGKNGAGSGQHFVCHPATNVWEAKTTIEMEGFVLEAALALHAADGRAVTAEDLKHIENTGAAQVLHALARRSVDRKLLERLDENVDVFAVDNGVFDMSMKEPRFRAARPDDWVMTTAGWSYSAEQADAHRAELRTFFEQVLPVEAERQVVLKFMAAPMSGRRRIKRFMILTDKRDGNNGKTTMMKLFQAFFGKFKANKGTDMVIQGAFARGRNDHDGGLEKLQGARLIVGDEFESHNVLDTTFIKRYVGGAMLTAGGRRMGSSEQFEFTWQAAFVLMWNQGCAPKMGTDGAFFERQVVAPMRSKFVEGVPVDAEPFTFEMDLDVQTKFAEWRSALADLLLSVYNPKETLSTLPPTMSEWRADIADEQNPLAPWLDEVLVRTTKDADRIVFDTRISDMHKHMAAPGRGEFIKSVKAYCKTRGIDFRPRWTPPHAKNTTVCNVAFGVKWAPDAPDGCKAKAPHEDPLGD